MTALTVRNALIRIKPARIALGDSNSAFYAKVAAGLVTRPIKTGPRSAALPLAEIEAVNAARIAGQSDVAIRALVQRLHSERVQVGA